MKTVITNIENGIPTVETVGTFKTNQGHMAFVGTIRGLRAFVKATRAPGQMINLQKDGAYAVLEVQK